jgi:hypothetical protein
MGVGTILEARRIFILAFGENKATIVARTVEGDTTPAIPATYLQKHSRTQFLTDAAAAAIDSSSSAVAGGGRVVGSGFDSSCGDLAVREVGQGHC